MGPDTDVGRALEYQQTSLAALVAAGCVLPWAQVMHPKSDPLPAGAPRRDVEHAAAGIGYMRSY
jgi:hypothetical protein